MKNKILPILLTFILISLLFINNNTFAVELVDQTSNGNNMYCPDLLFENVKALEEYSSYLAGDYKLLILQDGWLSGTDWFVYFLETDVNVYYDYARSNGYQIRFSAYNGVRYNCANDGIYELSNKTISFSYITCRVIEGTIQGYSSFNIYTDSSCTDFFFQNSTDGNTGDNTGNSGDTEIGDSGTDTGNDNNDTKTDYTGWFSNLVNGISDLLSAIRNLPLFIAEKVSSAFTGFFDTIGEITNNFKESVGSWFENVGTWFTNLTTSITDFFAGIPEFFSNFWTDIGNFFISIFVPEERLF